MVRIWCAGIAAALVAGCGLISSPVSAVKSVGSAAVGSPREAWGRGSGVTFYVDGNNGNDSNDCLSPQKACKTIQHGVSISSGGDTLMIAAAVYPENVTVHHALNFIGAGPGKTIINGERRSSEFVIAFQQIDVSISGMTMLNGIGAGEDGGAIYHCGGNLTLDDVVLENNDVRSVTHQRGNGYGGAMYNCPGTTLTVIDSTMRDNISEVGGAICNGGLLTIINSTFSDNRARELSGAGAIFNYGVLHVENSTFSGNVAETGLGGAIHNGELSGLTGGAIIDNVTISRNSAAGSQRPGGAIYNRFGLPIRIQNTILANNSPENCGGAQLGTLGFNIVSDESCHLDGAGDLDGVDAKLGRLQDNGGPTFTQAITALSPAVDAGDPSGCRNWNGQRLTSDQRGMPRPDDDERRGCDIGAYELQRS